MIRTSFALVAAMVLASVTPAPAASGNRTAVTEQQVVSVPRGYVIGTDDVLDVSYWGDKELSTQVAVRPDGFISLPLLKDVQAGGLTPGQLGDRIRDLARAYVQDPHVTVVVRQINSRKVFIIGEVVRPGVYDLSRRTTVLQLIAMAGGLTEFADRERIGIVRTDAGAAATFTFNYKDAMKLKGLDRNVELQPGDTVLVR